MSVWPATSGAAWLAVAGTLDLAAAALHLACIAGGPAWYRWVGAGERMVRAVERGSSRPTLITLAITLVLCAWSAIAFSGAGVLPHLPLLRPALVAITLIYLARALAMPILRRRMTDRSPAFHRNSALIVLGLAIAHGMGTLLRWQTL